MGEDSNISWTDHTFNGWIGCTEAGRGCDLCYARDLDARYQWGVPAAARVKGGPAPHWGIGAPRYRTSAANWRKPILWNADAMLADEPARVFAHSLSDVFDKEADPTWRADLFALMEKTPWLRWIVVTKRVPLIADMLPDDWSVMRYPNVGILATVVDQKEMDRDAGRLLAIPAAWHGFSVEPQLGRVEIPEAIRSHRGSVWIITGGESKQKGGREPIRYDVEWARSLIREAGSLDNVHIHVKQLGADPIGCDARRDGSLADPAEWPADVRVRDFPPELLL